jgi:hypothetical protein
MHTDEVDAASFTRRHERLEPIEPHTGAAIRHRRRTKVHLLLERFGRLHVFVPCGDGVGDGDAGAACAIAIAHISMSSLQTCIHRRQEKQEAERKG